MLPGIRKPMPIIAIPSSFKFEALFEKLLEQHIFFIFLENDSKLFFE